MVKNLGRLFHKEKKGKRGKNRQVNFLDGIREKQQQNSPVHKFTLHTRPSPKFSLEKLLKRERKVKEKEKTKEKQERRSPLREMSKVLFTSFS